MRRRLSWGKSGHLGWPAIAWRMSVASACVHDTIKPCAKAHESGPKADHRFARKWQWPSEVGREPGSVGSNIGRPRYVHGTTETRNAGPLNTSPSHNTIPTCSEPMTACATSNCAALMRELRFPVRQRSSGCFIWNGGTLAITSASVPVS